MTGKYKKIFERIILGAAAFWFAAFLADILIPWLLDIVRQPEGRMPFSEYGGIISTVAGIVCFVTILTALTVCVVKSKKNKK